MVAHTRGRAPARVAFTLIFRKMMPRRVRMALLFVVLSVISTQELFAGGPGTSRNPLAILPFVLLLLSIAILPVINKKSWGKWHPFIALGFASITASYYIFSLDDSSSLLRMGMEYASFILLIGSLFVIAGGIQIQTDRKSTPLANLLLLAAGAVISNLFGTTGAAMLLIRPFLHINRNRLKGFHIIFFIFVVCNIGGSLTPIGDPPLLLGYLRGIPFFWVSQNIWSAWIVATGFLLFLFYVIDTREFRKGALKNPGANGNRIVIRGLHNLFFLGLVVASLFVNDPPFLRELIIIIAAVGSYVSTRKDIHLENGFELGPIREVAFIFFGIFITMLPALQWLEANASVLGLMSPGQYYWGSGTLSSVLDNAPTYLNLLSASIGSFVDPKLLHEVSRMVQTHGVDLSSAGAGYSEEARKTFLMLANIHPQLVEHGSATTQDISIAYMLAMHELHLRAISVGTVFFGAVTYIGNGPNWIVKSMAERTGIKMPGFFDYILKYSLPILLPVFLLIWILFFRA